MSQSKSPLRTCQEAVFESFDRTRLFYRYWPARGADARAAIVLFHRGHEHGGRMAHLVDELDLPEYAFFAWDARGLGRSEGERGYAPSFAAMVKDVDAFMRHVSTQHGVAMAEIALIAQSVGAVLAATWVHDYAPAIRCMVLASPAFKVKLYVPFARQGLALLQKFRKKFFVNSYVKGRLLTHDAQRVASFQADPLITRPIAVNLLLGMDQAAERVIGDAAAMQVPTQLLVSGADWVVQQAPQHAFFARLGSPVKERHVFDGFYHDTLGERDRALALGKARAFLLQRFAAPASPPDLLHADRGGATRDEFERLKLPPASLAAKAYWAMARFWIRVGGRWSDGIRLSLDTGFDSGSTLDYVYRNQAGGATGLGRLIDRVYLDSIGWRGIRVRKLHLERLIGEAIGRLETAATPVRVLDIAAGHGRYILDALAARQARVEHVLLRDASARNVDAGRRLIAQAGMASIARFVRADAFERASLAALTPRPTLAVVSGLYELFSDNQMVAASLAGLADAVAEGGYLIYTGQPWHPQIELIARTLTSHRHGQPWIMRRRTQAELDQLVARAGFQKVEQFTDEWGIFTVSLGRRTACPAPL